MPEEKIKDMYDLGFEEKEIYEVADFFGRKIAQKLHQNYISLDEANLIHGRYCGCGSCLAFKGGE